MIFKGDLSKYHPADAMTFLSHVGSDGILNIVQTDCIITLTFKSGRLLDAQSRCGDQKLLRCLLHDGSVNGSQVRQIQQIRRETGLSVRQILGKLDFFPLADIQTPLTLSIYEVLLQLLILDHGSFDFTETPVEDDGAQIQLEPSKVVLKILPASDEYRDFIKTIQTLDRPVQINGDADLKDEAASAQKLILQHAAGNPTVQELFDSLPLFSHDVLHHLQQFMEKGTVSLLPPRKAPAQISQDKPPVLDPTFSAYKQALKALLSNKDVLPRLSAIVSFCKSYYDSMLILTAKQGEFVHCKTIDRSRENGFVQKSFKGNLGKVNGDPVFATVYRSGKAFFGNTFACALLDRFLEPRLNSECALIPMLIGPLVSIFFYARTSKRDSGVSSHHYLELLSWIVVPVQYPSDPKLPEQSDDAGRQQILTEQMPSGPQGVRDDDAPKRLQKMVSRIKDLPPLPNLVTSAMQMLSDPETPVEKIEAVIGQDQALVATLIKVGNSALYGGLQKVTTLRQVITRLGLKTTRNLILASSTRSYFLNNQKGMRVWGQSLWQHSVESGLAARRIAEVINYTDPEEAFIGGLVHDIGKLIELMLFPEPFKEILKLKKVHQMNSKSAEMKVIGYDHEQIGRLLMERWNMPEAAQASAGYHHRYYEADSHRDLAAMVAYADHLSRRYGAKPETLRDEDHDYAHDVASALKLSDPAVTSLAEAVIDEFQNAEIMME